MCQPGRPRSASAHRPSSGSRPGSANSNSASATKRNASRPGGHIGDPQYRVTVALPHSLQELQKKAMQSFGPNGRLKLYHHGVFPITEQAHLASVKHDDLVVCTWDDRRLTPNEFAQLLTTHNADYVKHPLPERAPLPKLAAAQPAGPFEGNSSYKMDYVKHPNCKRDPFISRANYKPNDAKTGNTTYKENYPWHDPQLDKTVKEQPVRQALPFTGSSSYSKDFAAPPPGMRTAPFMEQKRPRTPRKFEGVTNYQANYKEPPLARTMPVRPISMAYPTAPFEGMSEYTHEYLKKAQPQALVHLEPEKGCGRTLHF